MHGVFVVPANVKINDHGRERGAGDGKVPSGGWVCAISGFACGLVGNASPYMGFVTDVAPAVLEQSED